MHRCSPDPSKASRLIWVIEKDVALADHGRRAIAGSRNKSHQVCRLPGLILVCERLSSNLNGRASALFSTNTVRAAARSVRSAGTGSLSAIASLPAGTVFPAGIILALAERLSWGEIERE